MLAECVAVFASPAMRGDQARLLDPAASARAQLSAELERRAD